MNAERRKKLSEIVSRIEQLKADIETIRDEEQDYRDNMPEGFQNGEKGETAQTAIDALESAASACDEMTGSIEEAST